jgi:putative toxin-antitoxin system antitoxin component (TIGR02293 family)
MKELSGERHDWDVDQLFAFAEEVFGNKKKSQEWMRTEVVALGSTRPVDMMSTPEGRKWVRDVLEKIQEGFP